MRPGASSTLGVPMNVAWLGSATSSVTGVQCEAAVASLQKLSFVELCCQTV